MIRSVFENKIGSSSQPPPTTLLWPDLIAFKADTLNNSIVYQFWDEKNGYIESYGYTKGLVEVLTGL